MRSARSTRRRWGWAIPMALVLSLFMSGIALADNVQNDVTVGGNDTFTAGGSTTVSYRIIANNGDGQTGCNASDGSPAVVAINTPTGVTASPNPLSVSACGTFLPVTFSSSTPGNHAITVSVTDPGAGTYNTNPATFTLEVLAPSDSTPPVITPTVSGTEGANGWYVSNVTVSWSVTDAESAISNTSGCDTTTLSSDTTGTTITCTATSAGGTSSQSVSVKRDATAPSASAGAAPTPNGNGWNSSDVTVTFSGSDPSPGSGLAGCTTPISLSNEEAGQSASGTCTDNAGNSSTPVTASGINIDKTAPSVSASASPAANANGWNNGNVTVTFSGSDGLSGLAGCDAPVELTTEGVGLSATGSCTDNAGNIAEATASGIKIDKTAPSVSASVSPAANGHGWNNGAVTVSFSGTDTLSGVADCSAPVTVNTEGISQSVTGSCTDNAGNSASVTVSPINIDTTAPWVSAAVSPTSNTNGWNNGNVTVTFFGSDGLSGLAGCDAPVELTTEGVGLSATGSCTDKAGNSAEATASGIKIDKTKPVVSVTGVGNGGAYVLGQVPAAGCATTDALSGVAMPATLSVSGGPIGQVTATCSGAADEAGNTNSASVQYSVVYDFTGFFRPVDNLPTMNSVKAGSAVPMKFSLGGNQGLGILAGSPASKVVACDGSMTVDAIEETVAAGSSSLSYDATAGQYVYVWKTEKSWTGCRQFQLKLADGTTHYATFKFTK